MNLKDETPIIMISVGDLKKIIKDNLAVFDKNEDVVVEKHVYGLKGIQKLFNVSHATAQKYKDTILKDAVSQQGRKIVVDVEKALSLFSKGSL